MRTLCQHPRRLACRVTPEAAVLAGKSARNADV